MRCELPATGSAADTLFVPPVLACVLTRVPYSVISPHLQQQPAAGEGWRGTSLEPYIAAFSSSFLAPLAASSKAALNERAQAAAAEQRTQRADMSW
jgi:hypothetical protein